jgi:hypothetical protein
LLWKDSKMTKLQLIQAEIESLTFDEFLCLRNWINKLDDQQWEKQIEEDSIAVKLDFLIEEALFEKSKNQ